MNNPFKKDTVEDQKTALLKQLEELETKKQDQSMDKSMERALLHISKMATTGAIASCVSIGILLVICLWLTFG